MCAHPRASRECGESSRAAKRSGAAETCQAAKPRVVCLSPSQEPSPAPRRPRPGAAHWRRARRERCAELLAPSARARVHAVGGGDRGAVERRQVEPGRAADLLDVGEPLEDRVLLVAQDQERDRHVVGDRASTAPVTAYCDRALAEHADDRPARAARAARRPPRRGRSRGRRRRRRSSWPGREIRSRLRSASVLDGDSSTTIAVLGEHLGEGGDAPRRRWAGRTPRRASGPGAAPGRRARTRAPPRAAPRGSARRRRRSRRPSAPAPPRRDRW